MYSVRIQFSTCHTWQQIIHGSKALTGRRVLLLLPGEEQLSLATTSHLIYRSTDLLIDHSLEVQLYK